MKPRDICPCWGDGETGPRECSDTQPCELHFNIAKGLAAARLEGVRAGLEEACTLACEGCGVHGFNPVRDDDGRWWHGEGDDAGECEAWQIRDRIRSFDAEAAEPKEPTP